MLERPSNFIPPGNLKLVKNGSATVPMSAGLRYIVQVVDDYGVYPESKFATTVASRWPAVRAEYRMHYRNSMGKLKLGDIQVVPVQRNKKSRLRHRPGRLAEPDRGRCTPTSGENLRRPG